MIQIVKKLMFLGASAIFLFACQKDDEIGQSAEEDIATAFFESVKVNTFTIKGRENFETGNSALRLLAGKWAQGDSLTTECQTFFQLRLDDENENLATDPSTIVCDSIVLKLDFSYIYGDSTLSQDFEVSELDDTLDNSGNTNYLNTDNGLTSTSLVSKTVASIQPNTDNYLRFDLPTSFGEKIVELADSFNTNTNFVDQFSGLTVSSTSITGRGYVIGFAPTATNTKVIAYFRSDTKTATDSVIFNLSGAVRFNEISSDFGSGVSSLTNLENASLNTEVPSTSTDDITQFQSGSNFYTRIKFDTLSNILNTAKLGAKNVIINSAQLVFYEVDSLSSSNGERPVSFVGLYEDFNVSVDGVKDSLDFLLDTYDDELFSYTFDITEYVRNIKNGNKDQLSIILGASSQANDFDKNAINSSRIYGENGARPVEFNLEYSIIK